MKYLFGLAIGYGIVYVIGSMGLSIENIISTSNRLIDSLLDYVI